MAEITFKDLEKVNKEIKTTPIKGKDYAEVPQRVTAFRKLYPQGSISTELLSLENGVCVIQATVSDGNLVLGQGIAYENEGSTFINKTSYIENCETSAVGRALGFAGFGVDASIASALEIVNAINNQDEKPKKSEPKKSEPKKKSASKNDEQTLEGKIKTCNALIQETEADTKAMLTFFSDKYKREIGSVDEMVEAELNEAIKMLMQKKGDK